jgi:hypothetical protein
MAKLVYGLNQSLDGYVEHTNFLPSPALFRHFIDHMRGLAGIVYSCGLLALGGVIFDCNLLP